MRLYPSGQQSNVAVPASPLPSGERVRVRGECPSARASSLNPSPGASAPTSPLRGEVKTRAGHRMLETANEH